MPILADGRIPTARAIVFTVGPTDDLDLTFDTDIVNFEKVIINKITLFNNIQTIQTVVLFVRRKFGVFRKLRQYVLMQNESAEYLQGGEFLSLQPGDVLEAETTTADAVDFVVYGTLE
jgi:hypothetical protein